MLGGVRAMFLVELEKTGTGKWIGREFESGREGWDQTFVGKAYPELKDALEYCLGAAHQRGHLIHEMVVFGEEPAKLLDVPGVMAVKPGFFISY
jgi:hypothetical protein